MENTGFNILTVERDTGLSKDVLRVWERRYGFPQPVRDTRGERAYTSQQVEQLRLVKRLLDQGHRPGKILRTPPQQWAELLARPLAAASDLDDDLAALLDLVQQHDASAFRQAMQQRLLREGLQRFVRNTVAPLVHEVGAAWEAGRFAVFEEHFFTEMTQRLLRQAIASLTPGLGPRVLMATAPGEPHVLGLHMIEALWTLEGAECIALGPQVPLAEIARAAQAHAAEVVALSFSVAFPQRQLPEVLRQMREQLDPALALWVGGQGVSRVAAPEGVLLLANFDEAMLALAALRAGDAGRGGAAGGRLPC